MIEYTTGEIAKFVIPGTVCLALHNGKATGVIAATLPSSSNICANFIPPGPELIAAAIAAGGPGNPPVVALKKPNIFPPEMRLSVDQCY